MPERLYKNVREEAIFRFLDSISCFNLLCGWAEGQE